jgi:cytochrome c-type biogenesis protein CcsB
LYIFLLATATFIEKYQGTHTAQMLIYYSPFFILLQLLMVFNFIAVAISKRLLKKRKIGFIVLHIAFIVILLGAFVSHIFGEEGIFHLREGETSDQMFVQSNQGEKYRTLPFSMELVRFTLKRYPGSSSPSSYESHLIIHEDGKTYSKNISMNNVLDIKGYRFFQSSYDQDEKGTILSVNKDVAGRNITYAGYGFLLIGFILCFTGKNSRFRQLSTQLKELRNSDKLLILIPLFILFTLSSEAKESISVADAVQKAWIDRETASVFGHLLILSNNGRVEPVNTFSSEILRKLHKSETIGEMNSDQFLLSLFTFPEVWSQVPLIPVSNPDLVSFYHLTEGQCAYSESFDHVGNYKFSQKLREIYYKTPAEHTRFDKDLLKLDEQMNIFYQVKNFQLLNIFPKENDPDRQWYAPGDDLSVFSGQDSLFVSQIMLWCADELREAHASGDWSKAVSVLNMIDTYQQKKNNTIDIDDNRIKAELLYNRLDIFRFCKKYYFILGGITLVLSFMSFLKKQNKIIEAIRRLSIAGIILCFLYHLFGIGLRGYISGYAPWSNSYETMVYVAWVTILSGLFFSRRSPVTFALSTLFGGIILFVSGLNWMDPQINPLVPVLKSPWLMFHVAIIVAAYGFAGISCLTGLTNLILMLFAKTNLSGLSVRIRELSIINEMSMLIGLALMSIGIFLGAIWANESWGRYWGWDPKETWALITMITYAITLHLRLLKCLNHIWLFNLMSVISFFSVLMTYLGVNYFLSGMHSYGQNGSMQGVFIYFFVAVAVVILVGIFSYKKSSGSISEFVQDK